MALAYQRSLFAKLITDEASGNIAKNPKAAGIGRGNVVIRYGSAGPPNIVYEFTAAESKYGHPNYTVKIIVHFFCRAAF